MSRRRLASAMRPRGGRRSPRARWRFFPSCHVRKTLPPDVLSRLSPIFARREVLFFEAFSTSLGFLIMQPYRAFQWAASHSNEGQNEGSGSVAIGTATAIVRATLPQPPCPHSVAG